VVDRAQHAAHGLSPPYGQPLQPDLPNWAWHEYGMRVGFWRFLETSQEIQLKATLALNGSVCKSYPRVAERARSTAAGSSWATA
jgi:hypothetical protein